MNYNRLEGVSEVSERAHEHSEQLKRAERSAVERVSGVGGANERT